MAATKVIAVSNQGNGMDVDITLDDGSSKRVGVTRAHLEEDAGKSLLRRCLIPLCLFLALLALLHRLICSSCFSGCFYADISPGKVAHYVTASW